MCDRCLDATDFGSELCHLWLDPLIDTKLIKKLEEHELGDISSGGGEKTKETKPEATTRDHRCSALDPYLKGFVQIIVVVSSIAGIVSNWLAYSSYARRGVTPLQGPESLLRTLWLAQAICASITVPLAVLVKVIGPVCKWKISESISGYIVLIDLLIDNIGGLLISYYLFRVNNCWVEVEGSADADYLFWGLIVNIGFKLISSITQIIYGFVRGYILCFIRHCTPSADTTLQVALKSLHIVALCGVMVFGIIVMVTVINIRVDGSPVLVYVYNNDSLTSASVLTRFDDVYNGNSRQTAASYYNIYTGECFVYFVTFDENERTISYDYNYNYFDQSRNLICDGSNVISESQRPGPVYLDKDWKASLLKEWEKNGGDIITDSVTCVTLRGLFQNGTHVPCSLDTTCEEIK